MDSTNNQEPSDKTPIVYEEIVQMNMDEAQGNVRARASLFFWISGLSLINTILSAKGVYFILGLAISQIIDGIVIELTGDINYFISLFAPVLFALFGFFAFKLNRWAFIVGSIIYTIDGLIYLYFREWFAAGFHVIVLYKLFQGYKEITEYEKQLAKLV